MSLVPNKITKNHMFILELEHDTTSTSLEILTMLSFSSNDELGTQPLLEYSNDLPIYITKGEQIDDGGHIRMDNISHVCVGYFLMSPTHHDGRFLPTTYLGPYGINLVIEENAFQYLMKCKDII